MLGNCQSSASREGGVDLVTRTLSAPIRPVASVFTWTADLLSEFTSGIFNARALTQKVRNLENELSAAGQIPSRLERLEQENTRLRALLDMPKVSGRRSIPCDIQGHWPEEHRVQLNVGTRAGVNPGDPVVAPHGLVGQVVESAANLCYVNLITHPKFSVGVRVSRGTSQQIGLLRGRGDALLVLELPSADADAQPEDALITGGLSAIYPEGLLIGKITEIWTDPSFGIKGGYVKPSVNFNKIREVVVLTK